MNWVQASGGPVRQNPLVGMLANAIISGVMSRANAGDAMERESVKQDAANQRAALATAVREKEIEARANRDKMVNDRIASGMKTSVSPELRRERQLKDQWAKSTQWAPQESPLIQSDQPYFAPETRQGLGAMEQVPSQISEAVGMPGMGSFAQMLQSGKQPVAQRASEVAKLQATMPEEYRIPGSAANLMATRMSGENRMKALGLKNKAMLDAIKERNAGRLQQIGTQYYYKGNLLDKRLANDIRKIDKKLASAKQKNSYDAINRLEAKRAEILAKFASEPSYIKNMGGSPEEISAPFDEARKRIVMPGAADFMSKKSINNLVDSLPKAHVKEEKVIDQKYIDDLVRRVGPDRARQALDNAVSNGLRVRGEIR